MTEQNNYTLGEFVNAVFAQTSRAPSLADVKLIAHALEGIFSEVSSVETRKELQGRYSTMNNGGVEPAFAAALVHLGGSEEQEVAYRRFLIPSAPQEDAPQQKWKETAIADFRNRIDVFLDETDTSFITDVRLKELYTEDLFRKMLREYMEGVPDEQRPYVEEMCAKTIPKLQVHSQSRWQKRAYKERMWLVSAYVTRLKRGPIAHCAIPDLAEWEDVCDRVGVVLSWLLYYFVGLVSDGCAQERLAREVAEVLRYYHKHPVLGVAQKETNEWSVLVS